MRTVTVVEEMRKGPGYYASETRVPFIRLRGRWLEKYGFQPGAKVYIHEGVDGLTITATPPMQVSDTGLVPLEQIKSQYKALGIPTEEHPKKRKSARSKEPTAPDPQSPAARGEPFIVPTCGIANTDPLDMTDENFAAWLGCVTSEKHRAEWVAKRNKRKLKNAPLGKAAQLAFEFGGDNDPIPIEFFKPKKITAREYAKICKEY
jgi:hypothetical protein